MTDSRNDLIWNETIRIEQILSQINDIVNSATYYWTPAAANITF
jgi:hypothetical protein